MDTAAETLLIIVSSVVSVFLILLSVALIYLIKFLRRADHVADSVESAADAIKKGAYAMPFVRGLAKLKSKRGRR